MLEIQITNLDLLLLNLTKKLSLNLKMRLITIFRTPTQASVF